MVWIELGILCEQDRHLVSSVNGKLPTSSLEKGGTQAGRASEIDDNDRSLFITPLSRATPPTLPSCANSNSYYPTVLGVNAQQHYR